MHEFWHFDVLEIYVLGVELPYPVADILHLFQQILSLGFNSSWALVLFIDLGLYYLLDQDYNLVKLSMHYVYCPHLEL